MTEDSRTKAIRDALDALRRKDFDTMRGYFSPDIVWRVAGANPLSGTYTGVDELIALQQRRSELTNGTFRVEPVDMLTADEYVFVFMRATGERDGKHLDVLRAEVVKFGDDGTFEEYWSLANDQAAEDAFWS